MKLIRYRDPAGEIHHAAQLDIATPTRIHGNIWGTYTITDEPAQIATLLAPIEPSVIYCIGANYRLHGDEVGGMHPKRPLVFMKGINSVQHPGMAIQVPATATTSKLDYEGELAVVIGRRCRNVSKDDALNYVLGYTCANDVSARDWQLEWGESQWIRGKSFDTFCPLGPCLVTADELADPQQLALRTTLNGQVVQQSSTSKMIFSIATLVAFLSQDTTLLPGTVILTGTPEGVGMARKPPLWLKPGDSLAVEITGIGALVNPVNAYEDAPSANRLTVGAGSAS